MEKVGKGWEKVAKADNRLKFFGKICQKLAEVGRCWSVQSVDSGWHKLSDERWGLVGQRDQDGVMMG